MKLIFATATLIVFLTTTAKAQYEGNEDFDAIESQYTNENVDMSYNYGSPVESSDLPVFDFSEDSSEEPMPTEAELAYE